MTHNRRDVLRAVGVAGIAGGIAGCLGGGGGGSQGDETTETTTEEMTAGMTETTTAEMTTDSDGGDSMDGEGPTVTVSDHPDHGEILADADGMTLYLFTNDSEGESACYDGCAEAWPPLLVEGDPTPPEGGLPKPLETTERDDGSMQVVYDGWPLYYFASDSEPGDATGQGVNDVWFVVHPEGNEMMGEEAATTTTSDGGSGGGDGGSGGGRDGYSVGDY